MATSAVTLALARIGVGASEAGASPASMSFITDYFPKERRGLALSFFYMSSPIGMALTFSIGSVIAAAYGWHVAFFVAGGPGIILACLIRSEEHTSELQSLMRTPYAVFCLKKKNTI